MPDPYPIIEIDPAWVLEPEAMGSKEKFWYRRPGEDQVDWLFKFPQKNTGQHWAEKISAEVGALIRVPVARVELATFEGVAGSATESFAREGRELIHGNQIMAGAHPDYDRTVTFGQNEHTVKAIWSAIDSVFSNPAGAESNRRKMAGQLVLDALVANVDRHHENWGILRKRVGRRWQGFLSPSFDHASSLGRELLDERRKRILSENRVADYVRGGHGAVFWEATKKGPAPLSLLEKAAKWHPDDFRSALEEAAKVTPEAIHEVILPVPEHWMSSQARDFAFAIMCYNLQVIKGLSHSL